LLVNKEGEEFSYWSYRHILSSYRKRTVSGGYLEKRGAQIWDARKHSNAVRRGGGKRGKGKKLSKKGDLYLREGVR